MKAIAMEDLFDLDHTLAAQLLAGRVYPWEALPALADFIRALLCKLPADEYEEIAPEVYAARDAQVFPSAYLQGPTLIGHCAQIRHSAFIRGAALVGAGAVVGNSTELKNCILFDGAQAPHFNYVGDSILGWKAHLGAGAVTSNYRADHGPVTVKTAQGPVQTGLRKLGALVGDGAEIGCNAVLNPGTVIGRAAIVYPTCCVRGVLPPRTFLKNDGTRASRVMED